MLDIPYPFLDQPIFLVLLAIGKVNADIVWVALGRRDALVVELGAVDPSLVDPSLVEPRIGR